MAGFCSIFAMNKQYLKPGEMKSNLVLLLADDDADDREFFEEALRNVEPTASLINVADGAKAVQYLNSCIEEDLPCAIILDYNMPHMSGPDVLDWINLRQRYNNIAKFVWSTAPQKEFVQACLEKGALEYFVKPNNHHGLISVVTKIINACPVPGNIR